MGPVGSLPLRLEEKTTQYQVPGRSSPETPILILTVVTTLTTQGIMGSWDEHASVFEKQRLKALMRNSWSNQIPVLLTHKAVFKTPQNVKRRMATEPSNSAPGVCLREMKMLVYSQGSTWWVTAVLESGGLISTLYPFP